jgi:predicted O-methyltransferase YrrM
MLQPQDNYIRSLLEKREPSEILHFAEENLIPIITPEMENFLRVFLQLTKPKKILEIGTAIGYSAIFMHKISGAEIVTIEKKKEMVDFARKFCEGKPINIMTGDAVALLPNLNEKFDIVFVDGAKGQYLKMLPELMRLSKIIVCDNVLYKGKVASGEIEPRGQRTIVNNLRLFLEEISNNPALDTTILPLGDGVSISLVKNST